MFLKFLDSQSSATKKEKKSLYKGGRSVYDFLPWVDYDPKNKIWMLEDGQSVSTLIDIQPKSCEARPENYLEEISDSINTIINSVPQLDPPFVLQFFVYNEESLRDLKKRLSEHIPDDLKETKLTQDFLKRMAEHFSLISNPEGLFYDKDITDSPWFAKTYNVKLCMYRKLSSVNDLEIGITAVNELLEVSTTLINGLNGSGIKAKRDGQKELYEWMLPFFNDTTNYNDSIDELIKSVPYPGDENLPWGTDLVKLLFLNEPHS
ncbi:hypothetical protein DS885_03745, partial [Psychromonas sp. B3M02]|uniref:TraC family protein n=1 Tax=Psychromonas sp. B3M02 TaxID=2267226 RepID=UPI000DFE8A64